MKKKVLFVCIHNSARSQMAEAFLNHLGGAWFHAESAGLEPGKLNPNVIAVMHDAGIDISKNETKSVFDLLKQGKTYDIVVTVCDEASAEQCPLFPGNGVRLHWSFRDPSSFSGTKEAILPHVREVRDAIEAKIKEFIATTKGM